MGRTLYVPDLLSSLASCDPQYLEPLLGACVRTDLAQRQHDRVFAVPSRVLRSTDARALGGIGRGLAQLLFQLPHLKKIGMLVLPRLNLRDTGVWRVMKQMLPAIPWRTGRSLR